MRINNNCESLC